MKKSPPAFVSLLLLPLTVALVAASCAGGETAGNDGGGSATGGSGNPGTGGNNNPGTGGNNNPGTGGRVGGTGGIITVGTGGNNPGTGGVVNPGTGGVVTTGTGGVVTTGTGGTVSTGALTVMTGGYAASGTWQGYAYTFVGPAAPMTTTATISPMNFMTATQLCAMGMIAPDTTYNSVAGLGFSANQMMATTATEPPKNSVATTGTGMLVNVGSVTGLTLSAGSGSQLRVQVKTATGSFCAPIPAAGTSMIPWSMFNTMCWNSTAGAAFSAGAAITAIELVIPSTNAATIGPFNFCLLDAHPY